MSERSTAEHRRPAAHRARRSDRKRRGHADGTTGPDTRVAAHGSADAAADDAA